MRIGIYFDKDMNVIVNPIYISEQGVPTSSTNSITLKAGWSKTELAEIIMLGLKQSDMISSENNDKTNYWTVVTGIKGYATFSKRHRRVSVNYVESLNIYQISAQKRFKDGSYGLNKEDIERRLKTYSGQPSIETIADQVLEALEIDIADDNREL